MLLQTIHEFFLNGAKAFLKIDLTGTFKIPITSRGKVTTGRKTPNPWVPG